MVFLTLREHVLILYVVSICRGGLGLGVLVPNFFPMFCYDRGQFFQVILCFSSALVSNQFGLQVFNLVQRGLFRHLNAYFQPFPLM
jgi:hypothetical protein